MTGEDDIGILETYAEKKRQRERAGQPVLYRYDELPRRFLVQVVQILGRSIGDISARRHTGYVGSSVMFLGGAQRVSANDVWGRLNELVEHEFGEFDLDRNQKSERDKFASHLLDASVGIDDKLSAIQIAFTFLRGVDRLSPSYRADYGVDLSPEEAVRHLNYRFEQHDLGFRFEAGEILSVQSEHLYKEVVEPAIRLLEISGFDGALDEFMRAHRHARKGDIGNAITDANNAFESTMKLICNKRSISLRGHEDATDLIKIMTRDIIPSYMQSSLLQMKNLLQGLPTLRNQTPGAGHGSAGAQAPERYLGMYAINLAATNIVFLIEAWQSLESAAQSSRDKS